MYYPVAMNLEGRRVVVLGGDEEAARKVEGLLASGAEVTVVSLRADPRIADWAKTGRIAHMPRDYRDGDLAGAFLAVVCDAMHGERARVEAGRRGVLLNVLDRTELCDFIAVATFSRDGLQFGVHSSGKSAALTRRIRERLEEQYGPRYAELTELLGNLRPQVREVIPTAERRRRFWLEVVSEELLDRLEHGLDMGRLGEEILAQAAGFAENSSRMPTAKPSDQVADSPLAHQENG